ncbi:Yip1 family protein [Venatoribacter cucullus]|uniref:Yip1 family protein n=1 Tax=Venatoribacter cucullus TaxID=2661630 RepID=UPI002240DC9E|nr:Yip1 family protein [Venatoribacter cucullus]UZK03123.1 DUF1282 domain-containing protein [Venatoribacter cucullus]
MMLNHVLGLLTRPRHQWHMLRLQHSNSIVEVFIRYLLLLALIPTLALLVGTTLVGWSVAGSAPLLLSVQTAVPMALVFYLLLLVGVVMMAYIMFGMEHYFGIEPDFERCLVFTIFTSVPLFLAGLSGLYPMLLFNIPVVLAASAYSLYLLFVGLPVFMDLTPQQGAKFAIAIVVAGLAALIGCLAIIALVWLGGMAWLPA